MGDPVTVTYDAIGGGCDGTRRPDPRLPASTTTPPRPCKRPRGLLRISQASTAAAAGCNSRLTEEKALRLVLEVNALISQGACNRT